MYSWRCEVLVVYVYNFKSEFDAKLISSTCRDVLSWLRNTNAYRIYLYIDSFKFMRTK